MVVVSEPCLSRAGSPSIALHSNHILHPAAEQLAEPPPGDLGRHEDPPRWEFQKVTDLRKGPHNPLYGEQAHFWPVSITNPLQPADGPSSKLADLLLLPEHSNKPLPKTAMASMAKHSSACLISGGGTPYQRGRPKPSSLSQAVYQSKTKRSWAPRLGDTGKGHWWDYWIIECIAFASMAAVHRDGFWELLVQWPAKWMADFNYGLLRAQGIAACKQHLPPGPRGHVQGRQAMTHCDSARAATPHPLQWWQRWWTPSRGQEPRTGSSTPTCAGAMCVWCASYPHRRPRRMSWTT